MKFHLISTILLLALVGGCTADQLMRTDRAAAATTQPGSAEALGVLVSLATGNPGFGTLASLAALLGSNVWLYMRKGQYKTALRTVVNTVEPFIPNDEVQRDKLKEAQGPSTTALVKKVKA